MWRRMRRQDIEELAEQWRFEIPESDVEEFHALTEFLADTLDTMDGVPELTTENVPGVRDAGREPIDGEDPYNAVVRWCSVRLEGAEGLLAGRRVGVKDSIAIAGVPLSGGSHVLRDFVPTADSVVARRVLEAGGEIVAVLNMDLLALSGGGHTSAYGGTLCPFDTKRTAGGSSGGSGAALHYDDVDITLGTDQGGSIRVPAAWTGVIGLKPTHGLVPYVGILGIDQPVDHVGPMARTAADAARMLSVIAGREPADPRQPSEAPVKDYVRSVLEAASDLTGVRIGVVVEGFSDQVGADAATAAAVRGVIERLGELGAEIHEVSVPEHLRCSGMAFAGVVEGLTTLVEGGGNGYGWQGQYWPELSRAFAQGMTVHSDELSSEVKLALIYGTHMRREHWGEAYARARNMRKWLVAGYERALSEVDMLVMPTTPGPPHVLDAGLSISETVMRGWNVLANTTPTDLTGHPAISIPAAEVDGLPVGVMLVARHFDDDRLLAFAQTYEQRFGWSPAGPTDSREARWTTKSSGLEA